MIVNESIGPFFLRTTSMPLPKACAVLLLFVAFASQIHAQTIAPSSESLREGARTGDLAAVNAAIDAKLDVNSVDRYGVSALALACDHGHDNVVDALIKAGANVNIKDTFYHATPMDWAIMRGRASILEKLVAANADGIDAALLSAVEMKSEALIKPLLASGRAKLEGMKAALRAAQDAKLHAIAELIKQALPEDARNEQEESSSVDGDTSKPADSAAWAPFAGSYRNEAGTVLTITVGSEGLEARAADSDQALPLNPGEADQFLARGLELKFVREGEKVTGLTLKVGDVEKRYSRMETIPPASPGESAKAESKPAITLGPDFSFDQPNWPGFRGTMSRGIANGQSLPTTWDGASSKNIAWKVPIPGIGTSSPIVWGDRIFVTTAIQAEDMGGFKVGAYGDVDSVDVEGECQFVLYCLDLADGHIVWQQEAKRGVPKVKRHAKSSHANPTPVTDGKHVIASFGGEGIFCYTMDGTLVWERQLGLLDSGWFYDRTYQWGFASSPCLFEDLVILQCDHQDGSFITALNVNTGEEVWRTEREEIPTWSSPVAWTTPDGEPTVFVAGTKCSAAYNARTGAMLWELGGFSEIVVPTPQVTPDLVVLASGYAPTQPMVALKHGTYGELELPEDNQAELPFLWGVRRGGPYLPTPLIRGNKLYVLGNSGVLNCHDLGTGDRLFRKRMDNPAADAFSASPVAGDHHLYLTSEIGITFVVDFNSEGTIVAENALGESVLSTPAIVGGKILIRGETNIYAIEESAEKP
jgi:outer membrane protein assembly factor BamB